MRTEVIYGLFHPLYQTEFSDMSDEKLCLKWSDYQENVNSTFGSLRDDKEFSDVTLACDDGHQIKSHRIIIKSVLSQPAQREHTSDDFHEGSQVRYPPSHGRLPLQCKMCILVSMFTFQPNKLRHILKDAS